MNSSKTRMNPLINYHLKKQPYGPMLIVGRMIETIKKQLCNVKFSV